jgi:hypothetical protein
VGPVRNARPKGKQGTSNQGAARGPRVKAAPKTAEDLDKELEAFMGDGEGKSSKEKEVDVAMA